LNLVIGGAGDPNLMFTALGASSNNTGATSGATLTQTGSANLVAGSGPDSFTIVTFQSDYNTPTGINGKLQSSASNTFTNTALGDSQTFQSWFDQTNTNSMTTPSPVLTFISPSLNGVPPNTASNSSTAPLTSLAGVAAPFALVNEIGVTLTAAAGVSSQPTDQFTGSTVVTASVPEPTSLVPMLAALPVVLGLLRLYRRRARAIV